METDKYCNRSQPQRTLVRKTQADFETHTIAFRSMTVLPTYTKAGAFMSCWIVEWKIGENYVGLEDGISNAWEKGVADGAYCVCSCRSLLPYKDSSQIIEEQIDTTKGKERFAWNISITLIAVKDETLTDLRKTSWQSKRLRAGRAGELELVPRHGSCVRGVSQSEKNRQDTATLKLKPLSKINEQASSFKYIILSYFENPSNDNHTPSYRKQTKNRTVTGVNRNFSL
ncbi:hypothetical protein BCR33DRAFT_838365 [Rhizoclosmatium globosum]|uniref:Uncharacterized protein n=1 Tax=Rhizoclosmatium globosum TaxID=329046 RepID=A0A1Y2BGK8_9FUNG|nr:hypothetical protein BCR33DRAFT_838365 [Rhizoclosmatium globosum]|eukprot:ORY33856.1 hypothetical protein BCR33DRAFT_838365 [Rhizoclosmatium globosum]